MIELLLALLELVLNGLIETMHGTKKALRKLHKFEENSDSATKVRSSDVWQDGYADFSVKSVLEKSQQPVTITCDPSLFRQLVCDKCGELFYANDMDCTKTHDEIICPHTQCKGNHSETRLTLSQNGFVTQIGMGRTKRTNEYWTREIMVNGKWNYISLDGFHIETKYWGV